jgi:Ca2+-binding EF-hand superfamily protein
MSENQSSSSLPQLKLKAPGTANNRARRKSSVSGMGASCSRGKCNITDTQKEEIIDTFNALDRAREGHIAAPDLLTAIKIFGFEPSSAATDRAKGEKMGRHEFMSFMLAYASSQDRWCKREMYDLYRCMDRENAGFITDTQVCRILSRFGESITQQEVELELGQFFIRQNHHVEFDSFMMILSEAP